MKHIHSISRLAAAALACLPATSLAQTQLHDSLAAALTGHGELTFNVVPGYTNYTVEWAPTVNGPWTNSWAQLTQLSPPGNQHTVQVPMFYRVRALGSGLVTLPSRMGHVPPGEFLMGDNFAAGGDVRPVRPVTLSAFFVEKHEVTIALWNEVCQWGLAHGYEFDSPSLLGATNHPVSDIHWYDAVKWCNARSEKESLSPAYFTSETHATVYRTGWLDLNNADVEWTGNGYRLPTEAEWEKAARGALAGQHYPWASGAPDYLIHITGDQANYWNSGDPYDNGATPVGFYDGHQSVAGQRMANGFGLFDMAGNVSEMCWDRSAAYPSSAQTDPRGPDTGDRRVTRGGSWYDSAYDLRCATRKSFLPWLGGGQHGFRCVRSLSSPLAGL